MNAVVTLQIGADYGKIATITHPLMRRYAERIGADFAIITEPKIGGPFHAEKFQLYTLLERYERILFLDDDLLILPDCPNIFEVVPEEYFGAYNVSGDTVLHDNAIHKIQQLLENISWKEPYFNSGVMVISRCHREVFNLQSTDKMSDFMKVSGLDYFYDQTYINYMVQKLMIPLYDFGFKFNHTTASNTSFERFRSYIIHYPGFGHRYGSKFKQICSDSRIIDMPWLLELFRKYPILTILAGQTRLRLF